MKRSKRILHFRRWLLWSCLSGCSSLPLLAHADDSDDSGQTGLNRYFGLQPKSSDDDYDWSRHFRIGAMVGLNVRGTFSETGPFNVASPNGIYSDGYVLEDSSGNVGGETSNWGYDNASQYDGASTLQFHNVSSYSPSAPVNQDADAGPSAGFDLVYGANLFTFHKVRIGVELGFGLLPLSISDNQTFGINGTENTYSYNTGTIIVPDAPYQGGPDGGPLISDSTGSPSTQSITGAVSGSHRLDAILYSIRLGPSFYWDFNRYLGMSVGGGGAVGIVPGEYKYDEVITTQNGSSQNSGSFSKTDIVFGGDVNATLLFHTEDARRPVDIYLGVSYMPMGSADFSSGGRDARLNLQGQVYISAGVNWPF